jgi:hypothetical protein
LAVRLKNITVQKFLHFFGQVGETDRKAGIASLIKYSDAWLSAEKPLLKI